MRILLTGATGFIGSQIGRSLLESGHTLRAVLRDNSDRERIHDVADRLEVVQGDLFTTSTDLGPICDSVDLCVHSAWYAVPGKYLEAPENLDCVAGSLRLMTALADGGCRRVVFVGSCFEYDFDF